MPLDQTDQEALNDIRQRAAKILAKGRWKLISGEVKQRNLLWFSTHQDGDQHG